MRPRRCCSVGLNCPPPLLLPCYTCPPSPLPFTSYLALCSYTTLLFCHQHCAAVAPTPLTAPLLVICRTTDDFTADCSVIVVCPLADLGTRGRLTRLPCLPNPFTPSFPLPLCSFLPNAQQRLFFAAALMPFPYNPLPLALLPCLAPLPGVLWTWMDAPTAFWCYCPCLPLPAPTRCRPCPCPLLPLPLPLAAACLPYLALPPCWFPLALLCPTLAAMIDRCSARALPYLARHLPLTLALLVVPVGLVNAFAAPCVALPCATPLPCLAGCWWCVVRWCLAYNADRCTLLPRCGAGGWVSLLCALTPCLQATIAFLPSQRSPAAPCQKAQRLALLLPRFLLALTQRFDWLVVRDGLVARTPDGFQRQPAPLHALPAALGLITVGLPGPPRVRLVRCPFTAARGPACLAPFNAPCALVSYSGLRAPCPCPLPCPFALPVATQRYTTACQPRLVTLLSLAG